VAIRNSFHFDESAGVQEVAVGIYTYGHFLKGRLRRVPSSRLVYIPIAKTVQAMTFRTKLSKAEAEIVASLSSVPGRIYTRTQLAEHFYRFRRKGLLAKHTKLEEFLDFLVIRRKLLSVQLESKKYGKEVTRYCVGKPSPFALAASMRKNGYLSHGTAAYLHNLIRPAPDVIYLNVEQSPKVARESELTQPAIDRAFARKQRQSNLSFENQELVITIIAGKNTGRAGVEHVTHSSVPGIPATSLERTLIDIVVRPSYAGSIHQIFDALRAARERVSVRKLLAIRDQLNHTYPYAQSLGFLMQLADYNTEDLDLLRSRITNYKFYVVHGIKNREFDQDWRIFFPSELNNMRPS
jgi:predicted transcriptional regulator of viral defense system